MPLCLSMPHTTLYIPVYCTYLLMRLTLSRTARTRGWITISSILKRDALPAHAEHAHHLCNTRRLRCGRTLSFWFYWARARRCRGFRAAAPACARARERPRTPLAVGCSARVARLTRCCALSCLVWTARTPNMHARGDTSLHCYLMDLLS